MLGSAKAILVTLLIWLDIYTDAAFNMTTSKKLELEVLIPIAILLIITCYQKLTVEPIIESILLFIAKTFKANLIFMLTLSAGMTVAGLYTSSPYAFGIVGLSLILGCTFWYFHYCVIYLLDSIEKTTVC